MFFLAKALQAIAIVDVGFGLWLGMTSDASLWRELELTAIGVLLFYAGRAIERSA